MADIMDKFWSAPPVSRTLVAAIAVESLLVHGGLVNGYLALFHLPSLLKFPFPQIWRLITPFLLVGSGFNALWDLYMFWTYVTQLELNSPRFAQPGDFATYVAFIAATILAVAGLLLKSYIFTNALLLAFVYTYAQDNRGRKVHFIFFQIPAELLPWAMLGMSLVMGGTNAALQQGAGLVAAHLYDFLTRLYPTFQGGRNYIQTPTFVRDYFASARPATTQRAYGTSFRPQPAAQQIPSTGRSWTSGFSSGAWSGRGAGHRLGGD
ncbi:hypothetical protein LTS08_006151 [Lithohypha guttulata]|uniref:uncharacterized protein n=1 Tax=Lithohypha guttulata TaxID=1690604 RepID=UPI002DE0F83A|nr:hypothetical protein LTR51_002846 [Lithohypha guttulata]KAK5098773.1 hypothetical protein LTS08_006151 [Lithohypha guttulata]